METKTEKRYLISEKDYIRHINEKLEMYEAVKTLVNSIYALPLGRNVVALVDEAHRFEKEADAGFCGWGIPNTYLLYGDPDDLKKLMNKELTDPDEDCRDFEDYDDYDGEYDESDVTELIDIAHQLNELCGRLVTFADEKLDACGDEA